MKRPRNGWMERDATASTTPSPAAETVPSVPPPRIPTPPTSAYADSTRMSPSSSTHASTPAESTSRGPIVEGSTFSTRPARTDSRSSPRPLSVALAVRLKGSGSPSTNSESRNSSTKASIW